MNKLYNTQKEISTKINDFLLNVFPNIRKTQLKIIPFITIGMIISESVVASDIAKKLKDEFCLIQHDSVIRRIKRFFSNKLFDPYDFYSHIIKFVISNYKKKHPDKRVHIIFDHMFSHSNFTVFMITMRIGKQGIPLYFKCFSGKNNSNAFKTDTIKKGIAFVSSLFDKSFDLIFLADRGFNYIDIMKYIDSLGHTYCIRLKSNFKAKIKVPYRKNPVYMSLGEITSQVHHAKYFENVEFTNVGYITNIIVSRRKNLDEAWIIATNKNPSRAVRDYSYRFGGIECMFKNQKTNGFNLEKVCNADLKYFTSMYSIMCFCVLFLTILGAEYSKNKKSYKNLKITTHKKYKNNKIIRVKSLFNTGLTLFNLAYNSIKYIRLPIRFILYDI